MVPLYFYMRDEDSGWIIHRGVFSIAEKLAAPNSFSGNAMFVRRATDHLPDRGSGRNWGDIPEFCR